MKWRGEQMQDGGVRLGGAVVREQGSLHWKATLHT
jgi:hypothetical protein